MREEERETALPVERARVPAVMLAYNFDKNFMQLKNRIIIKKSAHPCQVILWVKECDKAESGFQNASINGGVQNTTIFII